MSGLASAGAAQPGSREALDAQMQFVGGLPPDHEIDRGSSHDDLGSGGRGTNPKKYPPSKFPAFAANVSKNHIGYKIREHALGEWLKYWSSHGRAREALNAIDRYFKTSERAFLIEEILDDAFEISFTAQGKTTAYKWLVRAHIARHGWQSWWTSSDEIKKRLAAAARLYPDRWREFIRDTSEQQAFYARRGYGFSIGLRYLVRFLLLVGQKKLATQYTETLTNLVVKELRDQPIPKLEWLS